MVKKQTFLKPENLNRVTGQLPVGQYPGDNYPPDNHHKDNYPSDCYPPGQLPSRTIIPVGQLSRRAITPITRTTTPKDYHPHRKLSGIIPNALPSLIGNWGEYFRVVGILEMVEKRVRYL